MSKIINTCIIELTREGWRGACLASESASDRLAAIELAREWLECLIRTGSLWDGVAHLYGYQAGSDSEDDAAIRECEMAMAYLDGVRGGYIEGLRMGMLYGHREVGS